MSKVGKMFKSNDSTPRSLGHPCSEAAHRAILQAANDLLNEDGFAALTVEAL